MPVLLTIVNDKTDQAHIEQLEKIYTDAQPERLAQLPNVNSAKSFVDTILQSQEHSFYCGLFNDRLIAAAVITQQSNTWQISHLCVRSITRRRGVGSRLLTLVIEAAKANNMATQVATNALMTQDHIILQRMGYTLSEAGDHYLLDIR
ncbi:acetyl-CoA sensor PanZ family protein [Oceanospirillum linum]|uniref:N-acetyltransferase domain-containing protein n=1 Tax=Oceanospirillum linum TaxID=966 RepID=A0A1T1HBP9_OCELI|nr:acetyl-CoA sensor PanZ family protein [Oceanospirillum linum]OOV87242.1 hypothetical protein BTA35_0209655 [Oceanospirillum linum]SEF78803.1 Acetyltransferase (GNAT) domain-containing protein [Oleiphilus messinensis]SMP18181.1 Acetyltransferase (GNAT) domain-containing protein [Oceanospirillum linum]